MMRVLGWLVTLTGVAFSTGCYPLRHGITYYPPGAINLPAGSSARQWQVAQSDKVHSDGLVLYEAAWIDRSAELGPAAIARIANACHSESEPLCTVTLEAAPDDSLNNKRVQAVSIWQASTVFHCHRNRLSLDIPMATSSTVQSRRRLLAR